MPKDKKISIEVLTAVRTRLRTAPKQDPASYKLEDAIAELMPDIKTCLGKGYDVASVAELMKEAGIEYSKASIIRLLPLKNGRDDARKSVEKSGSTAAEKVLPAVQANSAGSVLGDRLHQGNPVGVRTI